MDTNTEIWKDIEDYVGLYQVSNRGNIRRVDRGIKGVCENKVIAINIQKNTGYLYVTLSKKGISKKYLLHRIIAKAFIENPNNYPCINHKDETRTNNNLDNLEWCTHKYNSNYGTNTKRAKEHYDRNIVWKKHSKSVDQYDMKLNYIKTWDRASEIANHYKVACNNIYRVITGSQKSACGFIWKYTI